MTFAIPTPPTSRATAPRPRRSDVNALRAAARASIASEGRLTSTSSGCAGFAVRARTPLTSSTWSGSRAHVERRDVAFVVEVARRRREADDRGAVQRRRELDRVENPEDREPHAADHDLDPAAGPADAEPAGGRRSEDHGGVLETSPRRERRRRRVWRRPSRAATGRLRASRCRSSRLPGSTPSGTRSRPRRLSTRSSPPGRRGRPCAARCPAATASAPKID